MALKKENCVFEKILYPTDFSDVAAKALNYIKQLKDAGTKEVIVLNVIHQRIIDTLGTIRSTAYFQDARYMNDSEEAVKKLEADRRERLAPVVDELEAHGLLVKIRVEKGLPVKEILRAEKEEGVSAIVLGSHGRSNVAEMLIGSVSEKVIRRSQTPVLVIKR
jgi:nucleotide-binding universal stress UspA family protein